MIQIKDTHRACHAPLVTIMHLWSSKVLTASQSHVSLTTGRLAFKPNDVSKYFQKDSSKVWQRPNDIRTGGTSRFPDTIIKAAAYLGLAYGIDLKYVTGCTVPDMRPGKSGNLPAARVTLRDAPLAMSQLHNLDPAHIIAVHRQGCPEVAQAKRPHTGGCTRNAWESEVTVGGQTVEDARFCKGEIIGHLPPIAKIHYLRPTFMVYTQTCAPSFAITLRGCMMCSSKRLCGCNVVALWCKCRVKVVVHAAL